MILEFSDSGLGLQDLSSRVIAEPQVVVVMPCLDLATAKRSAQLMTTRSGVDGGVVLIVDDTARLGFIRIANTVFRFTGSRYFAYVAQDAFAGRFWLKRALAALQRKPSGLLGFNDGKWMGMLAAFGIAERTWANGNYSGNLFCPQYQRHYADTELTLVAMQQGHYCYDPQSVLVEVDWNKDGASVDALDHALFRQRAKSGFDGRVVDEKLRTLFA